MWLASQWILQYNVNNAIILHGQCLLAKRLPGDKSASALSKGLLNLEPPFLDNLGYTSGLVLTLGFKYTNKIISTLCRSLWI